MPTGTALISLIPPLPRANVRLVPGKVSPQASFISRFFLGSLDCLVNYRTCARVPVSVYEKKRERERRFQRYSISKDEFSVLIATTGN